MSNENSNQNSKPQTKPVAPANTREKSETINPNSNNKAKK